MQSSENGASPTGATTRATEQAEASQDLIYSKNGPIATITINRPNKLNTITPAMGQALFDISADINADNNIRVVILTGTGEKAFSAGSDVKVLDDYGTNWQLRNRADYNLNALGGAQANIAAIAGYCIGGGLRLPSLPDIPIASTTAKFGAGEIKLGWHGGAGNTQLLPRLVGYGKALQIATDRRSDYSRRGT